MVKAATAPAPAPYELVDRIYDAVIAAKPGAVARDGQRSFARSTFNAIVGGESLLAESGTGTGKSIGYLVGAIAAAEHMRAKTGRSLWRTVVITHTKALQDQLLGDCEKVADGAADALDRQPVMAVLKGASAYLCRVALADAMDGAKKTINSEPAPAAELDLGLPVEPTPEPAGLSEDDLAALDRLQAFLYLAGEAYDGDRADLPEPVSDRLWRAVTTTSEECLGAKQCPAAEECFLLHARERAANADVVITNQSLFVANVEAQGAILGDYDAVVIDEGHEFPDVLAYGLGDEITVGRIKAITRQARQYLDEDLVEKLRTDTSVFATALEHLADDQPPSDEIKTAMDLLSTSIHDARTALTKKKDAAMGTDKAPKLMKAKLALDGLAMSLWELGNAGDDKVVWREGGNVRPTLKSAAIDVSDDVAKHVLKPNATVVCSATLRHGGSFENMRRTWGAELSSRPIEEMVVPSPFDYAAQGIFYCPDGPNPARDRAGHERFVWDEMTELIQAAGGRALGLFTSLEAVRRAAEVLRSRLDFEILVQGDMPFRRLKERFQAEPETVLLGSRTFWQGVDTVGPSCNLVTIDKIAFPRKDDPLAIARRAKIEKEGRDGFNEAFLGPAITTMQQGVGRAIRSENDRAVIALLDPRPRTARYGRTIFRSLPPFSRIDNRDVVCGALARLRDSASAIAA